MAQYVVRNLLHDDDMNSLINLPKLEGREMGLESEIRTWLNVDPKGIFIAVNIESGEIVGCCSAIILSHSHGYVGMYVVNKHCRGAGLGRILWQTAMSHLGSRNVSLSAVSHMVRNYTDKAGFGVAADWTVDLYVCTKLCSPVTCLLNSHSVVIVQPDGVLMKHVVEYDRSIHSYDRTNVVLSTISEIGTVTVAVVELKDGFLVVMGYACMKKSLQGHWLIAPVYAENFSYASSLVHGLTGSLTAEQCDEGIVVKLTSKNHEAEKLFHSFGFRKTRYQLQRLFTRYIMEIPYSRIFALQSSIFCTE